MRLSVPASSVEVYLDEVVCSSLNRKGVFGLDCQLEPYQGMCIRIRLSVRALPGEVFLDKVVSLGLPRGGVFGCW